MIPPFIKAYAWAWRSTDSCLPYLKQFKFSSPGSSPRSHARREEGRLAVSFLFIFFFSALGIYFKASYHSAENLQSPSARYFFFKSRMHSSSPFFFFFGMIQVVACLPATIYAFLTGKPPRTRLRGYFYFILIFYKFLGIY